ncbi:hypothetical protein [Chondromyces crocatus]|uniref:J domain-containing protein n=1 Tax=Chondromyces crocatus TaxID=52 RepID=A0A0K1E522_CHOCO|nr:hypothetical protein [Chondromyces crocatus]AKT35980.1 uncharacterized protein CMC5_000920 [Chondromyces crocatus]
MSLSSSLAAARETLGLEGIPDDASTLKRAYRRAVTAHPPDRDPDRFRVIREAYELLLHPEPKVRELLLHPEPLVPPPPPPDAPPPAPPGTTAMALLRVIAARLDADDLAQLLGDDDGMDAPASDVPALDAPALDAPALDAPVPKLEPRNVKEKSQ